MFRGLTALAKGVSSPPPLWIAALSLAACSPEGGTGPDVDVPVATTEDVRFERYRDSQTGAGVPILTERGSGFDAREVDSPAVVFDGDRPSGDVYMLFYEATDDGGVSRIGLSTSTVADFSIPIVDRAQVIGLGAVGSAFEAGATDPTVVVASGQAGPRYRIWFEGRAGDGGAASAIVTGSSDDGVQWDSFRTCTGLSPSHATERIADPCVVRVGNTFRMWFEVQGVGLGLGAISYAESADGVSWTLRDAGGATGVDVAPVLSPRGGAAFDAAGVHAPFVTEDRTVTLDSPRRWQLWYEASDLVASTQNTIGVAFSQDGLSWTRLDAPVLAPSSDSLVPLPFDSGDLEHPTALIDESLSSDTSGHFLLWYTGDGESNLSPNRIGFARGRMVFVGADAP